jgi:23S rRNA C2498 (ribose-2'-O)-methylase RlmM
MNRGLQGLDLEQRLRSALLILEKMVIKLNDLFVERLDSDIFNIRTLSEDMRRFTAVLRDIVQLKKELSEAEASVDNRVVLLIRDVLVVFFRGLKEDLIKQFNIKTSDAVSFVNEKKKDLEEKIDKILREEERS